MKTPRLLAALATALAAGAASAQPANGDVLHDGRWRVTIEGEDGGRRAATLVVRQFAGEWIGAPGRGPAGRDACTGKKVPITVQESTAETLAFTVWGTQVSPKCPNLTIETRATEATREADEKVFEGTAEPGGKVRLARR